MEEGARPDGRMRLAPRVSIVASSSAPSARSALRLTSGPRRKSCPRGQRATTHLTPSAARPTAAPGGERRQCRRARVRGQRLLAQERSTEGVRRWRRRGGRRRYAPGTRDRLQGQIALGFGARVDPAQRRRHRRHGGRPGRSHGAGHLPTRSCSPCRSSSCARRSTTPRRAATTPNVAHRRDGMVRTASSTSGFASSTDAAWA